MTFTARIKQLLQTFTTRLDLSRHIQLPQIFRLDRTSVSHLRSQQIRMSIIISAPDPTEKKELRANLTINNSPTQLCHTQSHAFILRSGISFSLLCVGGTGRFREGNRKNFIFGFWFYPRMEKVRAYKGRKGDGDRCGMYRNAGFIVRGGRQRDDWRLLNELNNGCEAV